MFLGGVADAAFAMTPTTLGKGTLPSADQQGFVNGNAADQLRLHNSEFRQKWSQFTDILRHGGPTARRLSLFPIRCVSKSMLPSPMGMTSLLLTRVK